MLTGAPGDYLAKVLGQLVKAGTVSSSRGPKGGVRLTRPASDVTLLDVVNAVDPVRRLTECPLGKAEHQKQLCPLHAHINEAVASFEEALAAWR